ncbi:MAG TPA: hypothetical protein VEY12_04910 [Thermoplasmata archaeon]|nr:hypothetical protein [Thermoplasmata archaeon]
MIGPGKPKRPYRRLREGLPNPVEDPEVRRKISSALTARVAHGLPVGRPHNGENQDGSLDQAGTDVLEMKASGFSIREIAAHVGWSKTTVAEFVHRHLRRE